MCPKYEFTDETLNHEGHILHHIRRLSDGMRGGWIESEENLSQEGNCWVYGNAKVYGDARVFGNAKVYDDAIICGEAKIYDNADVSGNAWVSGHAEVYGNAWVHNEAQIYGNAQVYDNAEVYGHAKVCDDANVCGDTKVCDEIIDEDNNNNEQLIVVVQDFIYKVDDSNKLTTQTEYDSIDEFFNEPVKNDIKLDTLVICSIDTKEPLIKLQKVETEDKTEFKFIVEITNEDSDDFIFRSIIKSQDQLNQLIQKTIEALRLYPKFNKYADNLEEYL